MSSHLKQYCKRKTWSLPFINEERPRGPTRSYSQLMTALGLNRVPQLPVQDTQDLLCIISSILTKVQALSPRTTEETVPKEEALDSPTHFRGDCR